MRMRYIAIAALAHIFICLTSPTFGQVVTAKRIDARPPGHRLDTGSDNDPIIDDAWRARYGIVSTSDAGPCVIRVPDWIPGHEKAHPTARYYLYYSDHHGSQIQLAWAASIAGEWHPFNVGSATDRAWGKQGNYSGARTPGIGVLDRAQHDGPYSKDNPDALFNKKIHFVDVFVDDVNRRVVMYFHGIKGGGNTVATSKYGLNFNMPEYGGEQGHGMRRLRVTGWYLRSFELAGKAKGRKVMVRFGLSKATLYRAPIFNASGQVNTHANADEPGGWWNPTWPDDPLQRVNRRLRYWWPQLGPEHYPTTSPIIAPELFDPRKTISVDKSRGYEMGGRHFAIHHDPVHDRNHIYVFRSCGANLPETIGVIVFDLTGLSETDRLDPSKWKPVFGNVEQVLLKPQAYWEGIDRTYKPSHDGAGNSYSLHDPYVFQDTDGKLYLFYTGYGEANIGVAEVRITTTTKKALRVTAPHASHPLVAGNVYPIGWFTHGGIESVDIVYSLNGKDWNALAKGVDNKHLYLWTVPNVDTRSALVGVRETGGSLSATSEPFTITTGKAMTVVWPRRGMVLAAGQTYYPAYYHIGKMARVTFEYSVDGGQWIKLTESHSNTWERADWNMPGFAWTVPQIDSHAVRLRVSETGGSACAISEPFSIVTKSKQHED